MHIFFFTHDFDSGGSSRSLLILVRELAKQHKVSIVSLLPPRFSKNNLSQYKKLGVPVYVFNWGWLPASYVGCFVSEERQTMYYEQFKHNIPALLELLQPADLVCFNGFPTTSLAAKLPGKLPKFLIAREVVDKASRKYRETGAFLQRTIKHAIAISPMEAEQLADWRIPHTVIFNTSANTPEAHPLPPSPPVHFGMFGQIVPAKGQRNLLRACTLHADALRANGAIVHIYGDTGHPESDFLEAQISEHGIQDIVRMEGWEQDVEARMREMHCMIRTDVTGSPWGRDVIEAMSMGRPMAATGRNTVFIQPGINGELFAPDDPDALGGILVKLSGNPDILCEYARNAFSFARDNFDPAVNARAIEAILTGQA